MIDNTPSGVLFFFMSVKNVLIAGGGTAGWMAALYLAKTIGTDPKSGIQITLVESNDIRTVGVGEGTFPSIKTTLDTMGISETDFITHCDATFKQGIRFNNWTNNPADLPGDYYQHLFDPCHEMLGRFSMAPYWAMGGNDNVSYSESVTVQHNNVEQALGPKINGDRSYFGGFQYAYHLDAGKLAQFLKTKALALGVIHVVGTIQNVNQGENGLIESVDLNDKSQLAADFFVDCTGFASLLIGKTLDRDMTPISNQLFVDKAVTVQVPYSSEKAPIPSTTLTTAHEAGWTWDIGLRERRGIGYVYSSAHTDDDRAAHILRHYVPEADPADFRVIKMKTGYRRQSWHKNCVSIGLAGGFLEPLEATGIIFIEAALWLLAQYFPRDSEFEILSKHFNQAMQTRYANAISFLKMHYCLSQRTDHAFWADNRDPETIPDDLKVQLEMWRHRFPHRFDFNLGHETFGHDSYKYVLLGMGAIPDITNNKSAFPHQDMAKRHFKLIRDAAKQATGSMMSHRNLIEGIYEGRVKFK